MKVKLGVLSAALFLLAFAAPAVLAVTHLGTRTVVQVHKQPGDYHAQVPADASLGNPLMAHTATTQTFGVCPITANAVWYGPGGYAHAYGQIGACPGYYQLPLAIYSCLQDSVGGWHDQACGGDGKSVANSKNVSNSEFANCGHRKRTRTWGQDWWLNGAGIWQTASGNVYSAESYRC